MTHAPSPAARPCRYWQKRWYQTREQARRGAIHIRNMVEAQGRHYDTLYPYRCPDGDHWHLSHAQQSYKTCTHCRQRVPAWKAPNGDWVITYHKVPGRGHTIEHICSGEGSRACSTD